MSEKISLDSSVVTYVYMLLGIVLKDRSKISVAADALIAFSFRV